MFLFAARKKSDDFQRYIRRLIDVTSPNRAYSSGTERLATRSNRAIPAVICPWENHRPTIAKLVQAITKDLGDQGVGLIASQPLEFTEAVLGFCHEEATGGEPWFFLGKQRSGLPIGGGFWLAGFELTQFMNENWSDQLKPLVPLARNLLPSLSGEPAVAG